jgi:hypothetical protein
MRHSGKQVPKNAEKTVGDKVQRMTGYIDPTKETFCRLRFKRPRRSGPHAQSRTVRGKAAYPDGLSATGPEAYAAHDTAATPSSLGSAAASSGAVTSS